MLIRERHVLPLFFSSAGISLQIGSFSPKLFTMERFFTNHCSLFVDSTVLFILLIGGKGRTGTMICVWLVEAGVFSTATQSLDYFGNRRTDTNVSKKFQGVSKNCILLPKLFWHAVRKNCSSDREKHLKFEDEGQEFSKFLRSLDKFIQTVKGQNNFW